MPPFRSSIQYSIFPVLLACSSRSIRQLTFVASFSFAPRRIPPSRKFCHITYWIMRSRSLTHRLTAMGPLTLAAILLLSLPVVQAQVPQIKGYGVLFQDDFTGKSNTSPDPNKWIIDTGTSYPGGPPNWGTWEVQTYTNNSNNVRVNGAGNLQITAIKDTATGSWTSGRIESRQADFMARRGGILRVQASLKIPSLGGYAGIGYWPAFWTLGSAYRGNYW